MHRRNTIAALTATAATFAGLLTWQTASAPGRPALDERGRGAAAEPDRTPMDPSGAVVPAPAPERPYAPLVSPSAPKGPAVPFAPREKPTVDDADRTELDGDEHPVRTPPAPARPKAKRSEREPRTKAHGDGERHHGPEERRSAGVVEKDTVGDAVDLFIPGADEVVEAVPDWAWPFRAFLGSVCEPGTPVEVKVTATDPTTDAVTVTATLTAADGPLEGAPLEVAVTVTPPAPETPHGPATVAVEVTRTDTGETATTERTTPVEAVTVIATVATVGTVSDLLQDDFAPAA
ncbi:hypothetical protein ACWECC_23800 [Streptomyces microflavus]